MIFGTIFSKDFSEIGRNNRTKAATLCVLSLLLGVFTLSACSTRPVFDKYHMDEKTYEKVIDQNTKHVQNYDGMQNTFEFTSTLLTSEVLEAQQRRQATLLQWDEPFFQTERTKQLAKNIKQSSIFVSFFTPEKKHSDLARTKTLWKVYLDVNGKRYEGLPTKVKLLTAEVQGAYPFHNQWASPYQVDFPVALVEVESQHPKVTITGPIDATEIQF